MGRYPDLQPALPTSFVKPSQTSRILLPGIVLATAVILGCVSLVALIVAASVFESESLRTSGVITTQAFALSASFFSITYLIFHAFAASYNKPVGVVRPPELKLHAACFILARMLLVFWVSTFIAAMITVLKPNVGMKGSRDCQLQVADVVCSIVALVATGIILTAQEACKYPFRLPDFFHITKKITVRVSSFGEDFLDRSISRETSFDNDNPFETEKIDAVNQKPGTNRKPVAERMSDDSQASVERPLTPLLQIHMPRRTTSRGWGEEWTHLARERSLGSEKSLEKSSDKKVLSHSNSGISLSYDSSSGYISSSESECVSGSRRPAHKTSSHRRSDISPSATVARRARPRIITPSSRISNFSRRSPLSTMRNAEYPDVVVRPDLRYCPPMIPPPHEWNSSRTASISQLIPVADIHGLQRKPSLCFPEQLKIREPNKNLPLLPRAPTAPLMRRKTSDIRVPGAFVESRLSFDQEANLDEHLKKIEVAYVTRRESNQNPQGDRPIRHRPLIQSPRFRQHKMPMQSPYMPQRMSSFQSDRSIHHKASAQGKYPLRHKSSVHSDRALQHKTSMHSDRSSRSRKSSVKLPAVDETEKRSPSIRVESKSRRYRGQKSLVHRPSTSIGAKQARPATGHVIESARKEENKGFLFSRLSLGDLILGLGDVEKIFESEEH